MIYKILDDAKNVINTIIADEEFVEKYHPGRYELVGPEPAPHTPPIITKVAFRFRLTDNEYVDILSAAKNDIEVFAWVETFNMVNTIELNNQRTIDGIQNLVSKNLLTQERADEILTDPVQDNEKPAS
jgi:hypothetical protein